MQLADGQKNYWGCKKSDLANGQRTKNYSELQKPAGGAKKFEEQEKNRVAKKGVIYKSSRGDANWSRGGAKWASAAGRRPNPLSDD